MTTCFLQTAIPTFARGKVRAFIKARAEWATWCETHDIESRAATNKELLFFADQMGYQQDVLNIISSAPTLSVHIATPTAAEMEQIEMESAATGDDAETVWFAGPAGSGMSETVSADDVLASVDQFLSPLVKAELAKALAPIIAAANKPAVVVEVEKEVIRTVIEAAPKEAPKGELAYATKGNQISLGKLFGIKGEHASKVVHLWESHGAAPSIDPYYVVDAFNMAAAATALDTGQNVWLVGPGGSGKTTLPQQFCAYTGRPFVKINFTRNSHIDDMVGGQGVTNGTSGWQDGVLIQAMKRPGTVILLDEISLAPAGVQGLFQGTADEHRTYTLPTGEKVTAANGVVFCVADNTNGQGDDTGLYQGTNQCNAALVDRFALMLRIEYMSIQTEAAALHNHTKAPLAACTHMAEFAARARKLPSMENAVFSLRGMAAFVRMVAKGFSVKQASQATILNKMVAQDRAALETLFTLTWEKDFSDLIAGKDVKVPQPTAYGFTVADGGAFDDEVTASLNR